MLKLMSASTNEIARNAGAYEIDQDLSELIARTPVPSLKEIASTMRGAVRVIIREKYRDVEPTFKGKHAFEWFQERLKLLAVRDRETLLRGLVRLGYLRVIADDNGSLMSSRFAFASPITPVSLSSSPTVSDSSRSIKWSDTDSNSSQSKFSNTQPTSSTAKSPDPRMKMSTAREMRSPLASPMIPPASALATPMSSVAPPSALSGAVVSPRSQTPPPSSSASTVTPTTTAAANTSPPLISSTMSSRATVAASNSGPAPTGSSGLGVSNSNSNLSASVFASARPKNDARSQPRNLNTSSGNLVGSSIVSSNSSPNTIVQTSVSSSSIARPVPPLSQTPPAAPFNSSVSPVPQSSSSLLLHMLPVHKSPRGAHVELPILGAAREADLGITVFAASHASHPSTRGTPPHMSVLSSSGTIPDLSLPNSPKVRGPDSPGTPSSAKDSERKEKDKRSKKDKKDKDKKEKRDKDKKEKTSSKKDASPLGPSPRDADSRPRALRPLSESANLDKPFSAARAVPLISSQRAGGGAQPSLGKYSPRPSANLDEGVRPLYVLECEIFGELEAAWKGPCGTLSDVLPGMYNAKAALATMPQLRVFHERLVHDLENRLSLSKSVARLCDSTFLKWHLLYIAANRYANEIIQIHRQLLESRSVDVPLLQEFVNRPCRHLQRLSFTLGRIVDAQRGVSAESSAKLAVMLLPLHHTIQEIERRTAAGSDPLVWDLHQRLGGKVPLCGAYPPLRMLLSARCVSGDVEQHVFLLDQMLVITRMEAPPALVLRETLPLFELSARDVPDSTGAQNVIEVKPNSSESSSVIAINFASQAEKEAWAYRLPNIRRVLRMPVEF